MQDGEAGGITQQIGATNVPKDTIVEQAKMAKNVRQQTHTDITPGLMTSYLFITNSDICLYSLTKIT